jgi:hypothetical protein
MTFEEAVARLTGPGQPFALAEAEIGGQKLQVFERTPPALRAVFDNARRHGDKVFLVYEDERLTFADVMAQVDALAAALVERYRVGRGDRVAIAMRNYPEWIVSFAAVTSIGAVAVALNAWWKTDELAYGLADSGSKVLIADAERLERCAPLLGSLALRTLAVRVQGPVPPGVERFEDVARPGPALPQATIDPHDDAMILYTSGTTGEPKGAVSTHHAVLSALLAFACRAAVRGSVAGPEHSQQLLVVERLAQEREVPARTRFRFEMLGPVAGDHEHRGAGMGLVEPIGEGQTVFAAHLVVGDEHAHLHEARERRQLGRRGEVAHPVSILAQVLGQTAAEGVVVVDQQHHRFRCGPDPCVASRHGRRFRGVASWRARSSRRGRGRSA